MKDPKAIRKAIMTAKSIAAMVDPHFARVPLPEIGAPAPDMAMPEPQQFAAGGDVGGHVVNNPMSVFPKPQRMWDGDMPGGAYLSMPDKSDVTGHKAAQASIGIGEGGKPYFHASRDEVDETGTPGKGSALVKTNLFKQKAGWRWLQAPEGHEGTGTIVSVEHRGNHHYVLDAHFPNGVELSRYPDAPSEPRLRPTTRGSVELGPQVGSILVRGREHPVHSHAIVREYGGRVGYADGGMPDDDQGRSPIIMVHGGSDFEDIDPSRYGSGEPGGIRPLGKGLYGFVLHSGNMDEAPRVVDFARHYATKYGRGKKAIHAFRLDLTGADTGFNGQVIENLRGETGPERQFLDAAYEHQDTFPLGSDEWWDATKKVRDAERALQKSQAARFERLPVGLIEGAVHAPHRLKRIGKIDLDQPDEHLLDIIHREMGTKREYGGRVGYADGGMPDDGTPDYATPDNLGLYSHAAATAASLPQAKASPAEFRGMLANRGVKPSEFEESGYDQAFADQPQVTREQVAAHFHENRTPIVEKSFRTNVPESEMEAFREKYVNPLDEASKRLVAAHTEAQNNGVNLRDNPTEEYQRLSDEYRRIREGYDKAIQGLQSGKPHHENWTLPGGENYREVLLKHGGDDTLFGGYHGHFKGEPNILTHLLMSDRTDEEGKRVLHLDELQSDWAQKGRKSGFNQGPDVGKKLISDFNEYSGSLLDRALERMSERARERGLSQEGTSDLLQAVRMERNPAHLAYHVGGEDEVARYNQMREAAENAHNGISTAPYVTNTNDWVDLGLKRALWEAAKNGHDKLVWTPGQTVADRYDLSKHVTAIHHEKNEDGTYNLLAIDRNGSKVYGDRGVPEGKLEETFGKEIAGKIASGEGLGREEAQAKVDAAKKEYDDLKDRMVEKHLNNWRELNPDLIRSEEEAQTARGAIKRVVERDSYTHAQNHGFGEEHDTLHGNLMDARHAMNQIPNAPGSNWRSLSGIDLKVGGEGMKKFYDSIVPKRLMALAKKHDPEAKFSTSTVRHPESHDENEGNDSYTDLHALEITPRMRESILKRGFVARASGGEVEGYADGGTVGGYQDPETRYISDWNWRPVEDVQQSLGGMKEIPSHVEKFGDFMDNIAKRAGSGGLTVRDLIKAYTITRSSIQRQAADVNRLRASGLALPEDMTGKIRPEGAFGEWLHTPAGQAYLDAAEKGKIHQTAIQNAVKVMAPFGRHQTDIPDALTWAALNLPGKEKQVSELVHAGHLMASTPAEWREFTQNIRGVGPSKSGFLASLMGRGDQPTLDARQIILHTGRPTKEAGKYIAKKGGAGGVEAVDRLAARQSAMDLSLPDRLKPYYQHLAHHAVWDKAGGDETTHEDVVRAMHHAANGGFQTADDDGSILGHPVAQTILAAAHGGDVLDNELFQKYVKRIHSPLSDDPNSVRKALEIAESYRHKTGAETGTGSLYSIKQSIPASSVTRTIGNIPGVNLKPIKKGTWEDFYNTAKGAEFVNVGGDLSGFGRLTHINGKPLAWPVDLHAGADYMREPNPKRVWANIQAHATSYKNKILDAQERGKDLYGIFSPMGPSAVNSSHNMFDTLMAQIPNAGIAPEHIKEFNEAIKRGDHLASIKKNKPGLFNEYIERLEKWPGLENAKEASDFARPETGNINGGHRTKIVEFMDKGYWRDRGFPEVGVTRAAITNPDLLGAGGNKLGFRAIKLSADEPAGGKKIFKHSTYPVDTFGEYVMDLPLVQRHYAQPDVIDRLVMSPAKGGQIVHPYSEDPMGRSTARKMFEEQKQVQPVNQRFLDSVMTGMENQQKYGFKKGGKVRSALMIAKGLKKS